VASKLGSRFDKLSVASGISNLGDGVMGAAFPLLVATLTRDPLLVAAATFVGRLPWFLFALISGALVDRMDRKRVMVITDALRAVGVGILAVGILTGDAGLFLVYAIAFALGTAETFFDTSAEALTPNLVDDDHLPAANGRLGALEFVGGSLIGPALGAFLFAMATAIPFFANSLSFVIAALVMLMIPGSFRATRMGDQSLGADIKEGLSWLWGRKVLRTLVIMAGVTNLFTFGMIAIFVLYAQDILGVSDIGYGVLLSVMGVGGLVGALIAPRFVARFGGGVVLRISVVASSVLSLTFGFISSAVAAGAILFAYLMLIAGWNVVSVTLRQTLTPDELRARVSGSARLLAFGTQPIGALLGGLLAGWFGIRSPFFVAAGAFAIMGVFTWSIISNESIEAARSASPAT